MTLLENRGFDYDPDIVVITFHTGDILESPDDAVAGTGSRGQGAPGWLHRAKLAALKQSYLARLIIPYGAAFLRGTFGSTAGVTYSEEEEIRSDGKTWQALRARLLGLKRELDRREVVLAFALFPTMLPFENHPASGEFKALAEWLEAHGIPSIDLLPFYRGQRAGALTASLLDKHPNEAGYAIAGEAVAGFVGVLVKRQRGEKRAAGGG